MRRKFGIVAIAAVIGFSGFFSSGLTEKVSANEMQERLEDVKKQRWNNDSTKSKKQEEVKELEAEKKISSKKLSA